ncbi:MAG: hypothetical protein HC853_07475 [Anaerolineae bacterium]|nr:hypothetical protein [Anaerolineae bacterium]
MATLGNKKLDGLARLIAVAGILLRCAITLQPAVAQEPPPGSAWTPYPDIGSCTNCREYQWTIPETGVECTKVVCIDPRWQAGLCFAKIKCAPFETTGCGVTGVERCSYTCKDENTYNPPVCTVIGNGGNFRRTYCDYNAGCANDPGGFVNGKPVTVNMLCTQMGCNKRLLQVFVARVAARSI